MAFAADFKRAYANRGVGHKRKPSDTGREVQLPLDREELLGLMQDSLEGLAVELGLLVASALLEDEVTGKSCRSPGSGSVGPDGGGEVTLRTYAKLH